MSSNEVMKIMDGGTGDLFYKTVHLPAMISRGADEETLRREGEGIWSANALVNPGYHEALRGIHIGFIEAGARFVKTGNFAVRPGNGFTADEVETYARLAKRLAREAILRAGGTREVTIMCCLPPLMQCFNGSLDGDNFLKTTGVEIYERFLHGYDDARDDIMPKQVYLGETLNSVDEAFQIMDALALHVSKKLRETNSPRLDDDARPELILSFTLTREGKLFTGMTVSEAFSRVLSKLGDYKSSLRLRALSLNCAPPEAISLALASLPPSLRESLRSSEYDVELGCYPNRYLPVDETQELQQEARAEITVQSFVEQVREWRERYGVTWVGGCCGMGYEYIDALGRDAWSARFA